MLLKTTSSYYLKYLNIFEPDISINNLNIFLFNLLFFPSLSRLLFIYLFFFFPEKLQSCVENVSFETGWPRPPKYGWVFRKTLQEPFQGWHLPLEFPDRSPKDELSFNSCCSWHFKGQTLIQFCVMIAKPTVAIGAMLLFTFLAFCLGYQPDVIATTTEDTPKEGSQCLWIGFQRLECHVKILDDTFGTWVTSGSWPTVTNFSLLPKSFNSSFLSSTRLSSSSLRSSSSLLPSFQSHHERRIITALVIKCHRPAAVNSSLSSLTFQVFLVRVSWFILYVLRVEAY